MEVDAAPRDTPTSSSSAVAGITVSIEDDPPPIVTAVARDLVACLGEDAAFADATRGLRGVVCLRSATTPQSVTLRLADAAVSLAHGTAEDADVTAATELGGADGGDASKDSAEHPELAGWVARLLRPPVPEWPQAAERFWEVLSRMPGAPAALLVVELESGERRRFGSPEGPAYEIHGTPEGLAAVLTGRMPVLDAAFERAIYLRCSFAAISVLSGAGFRIRFGRDPAGERGRDPADGGGRDPADGG